MSSVVNKNEPSVDKWEKWKYWIIFWGILLGLAFAIYMNHISPPITPPTHIKSSDPYWYSGD